MLLSCLAALVYLPSAQACCGDWLVLSLDALIAQMAALQDSELGWGCALTSNFLLFIYDRTDAG